MNVNTVRVNQKAANITTNTNYGTVGYPVSLSPNCDYPCNTTNLIHPPGYICSPTDSWNCNLCGNDSSYFNPIAAGDTLYFQLQIQNNKNYSSGVKFKGPGANYFSLPSTPRIKYGWYHHSQNPSYQTIRAQIFDACTDTEYKKSGDSFNYIDTITDQASVMLVQDVKASAKMLPTNAQYKWVQNLQITLPATLPNDFPNVFYIKFTIKDYSNGTSELYTEPYKVVNCLDTVLIEGVYGKEDCLFMTYQAGMNLKPNQDMNPVPYVLDALYLYPNRPITAAYRNLFRIPGSIVKSGVNITKDIPERSCEATKISYQQLYRLRTTQLPPYIADRIGIVFAGKTGYLTTDKLGTIQFPNAGRLEKNNEKSNMWIVDTELMGCICLDYHQC